MKKLLKRLRSQRGESLMESMAAILLFTMGSISMFHLVMTANESNMKVRKFTDKMNKQMVVLEKAEIDPSDTDNILTPGKIKFTFPSSTPGVEGISDSIDVVIFSGKEDGSLFTYFKK